MTTVEETNGASGERDWIEQLVGAPGATWLVRAKLREWAGLVGMVVASDLLLFRGQGYLGVAVFFLVAPVLLLLGILQRSFRWSAVIQGVLLLVLCGRLAWQGSALQMVCGFTLIAGLAVSVSGLAPHFVTVVAMIGQCAVGGAQIISGYLMGIRGSRRPVDGFAIAKALLPIAAVVIFATIFVLANPDAVKLVSDKFVQFLENVSRFITELDLSLPEVIFWGFTTWITVGLFLRSSY